MVSVSEDVFRFVAVRDPQRPVGRGALLARAYDAAEPSPLERQLRDASGATARSAVADRFIVEPPQPRRFIASFDDAPELIRELDGELVRAMDRRSGAQILRSALPSLRALSGPSPPAVGEDEEVRALLGADAVHEQWRDCADSMLAATFATRPPPLARAVLPRILLLWEVLDRLASDANVDPDEIADLLATGVVLVPGDLLAQAPAERPRSRGGGLREGRGEDEGGGNGETGTLTRLRELVATVDDLRRALLRPRPLTIAPATAAEIVAVSAAVTDGSNFDAAAAADATVADITLSILREDLQARTLALLRDEGLAADDLTVTEVIDALSVRAESTMAGLLAAPELEVKRHAVAVELARRRPWSATGGFDVTPVAVELGTPSRVSAARLLSRPVIGDLKVVRQTLSGYELGEIAHVENVLIGEVRTRRHRVVDTTEEETIERIARDEERSFDTQTTERSELQTQMQEALSSNEQFNAGVTVTASYGPYFSATANAGYAKSQSTSEASSASTRFARELTERAVRRLRESTETQRRRLARQVVTELNRHDFDNTGGTDNVVGVYRWLNKRYCAQVFNYGRRVLLEVGVADPSASFRYAEALGAGVEVDVDPPPPLVFPGTTRPLNPAEINPMYWQALAAAFRVADFPPPPPDLITATVAFSAEAAPPPPAPEDQPQGSGNQPPQQPPPQPPPRLYKTNEQLTIPEGYVPLSFTACILCDRPSVPATPGFPQPDPSPFNETEKNLIRGGVAPFIAAEPADRQPRLLAMLNTFLDWSPYTQDFTLTSEQIADLVTLTGFLSLVNPSALSPFQWRVNMFAFTDAGTTRNLPRAGLDLAVGPALVHAPPGAHKIKGPFSLGQLLGQTPELTTAGPSDMTVPLAAATGGGAGFAVTVSVICEGSLEARWQAQAYQAIVAAHAAWESEFRAAVAAARQRGGVQIEGRNPLENQRIIRTELKRSVVAMLGGVNDDELKAVIPGNPLPTGDPPQPTPPRVDLDAAARAGRTIRFYEQAFEWENIAYLLYPYFWTGRDDWPAALLAADPDPDFAQFLASGFARVVLPVRPGFENVVESRLGLDLPEPFTTSPAPVPSDDPSLPIADEIRLAQAFAGGVPDGDPWPVVVPTTLVALDGTPMPTFPTACDPPDPDPVP
jgi:hypothetical protein